MTEARIVDEPRSFEEHFLAAYLVAVERSEEVHLQVPHQQSKHANMAALGYSPHRGTWVGCDVLDWFDSGWPKEMDPAKVLPKLRERVELFHSRVSLEQALKRAKTTPRERFVFVGFGRLSPRLFAALPGVSEGVVMEPDPPTFPQGTVVEVLPLCGEPLREAARVLGTFSLSPEAPEKNHFVRAARLLAEAGWGSVEHEPRHRKPSPSSSAGGGVA